jgi:hypothetical protein
VDRRSRSYAFTDRDSLLAGNLAGNFQKSANLPLFFLLARQIAQRFQAFAVNFRTGTPGNFSRRTRKKVEDSLEGRCCLDFIEVRSDKCIIGRFLFTVKGGGCLRVPSCAFLCLPVQHVGAEDRDKPQARQVPAVQNSTIMHNAGKHCYIRLNRSF